METPATLPTSIRIAIRNTAKKELKLYLEPWGEEFQMPMQSELIFVGHGPVKGSGFTVDYDEESVILSGWTGSTVQVFSKGEEIGDTSWRPPVPDFDSQD
jgi:hypothetical protein